MDIRDYILTCVAGLIAGAIAGGIGGLSLGWALAFTYHRRGPSDLADAPAMVAMGLGLFGACVGAVAGFIIGMICTVRLAKRRKASPSSDSSLKR